MLILFYLLYSCAPLLASPEIIGGYNSWVRAEFVKEKANARLPPLSEGLETHPGEFPFVVSFQRFISNSRKWDHKCQGTLLNETHIITTALCATWLWETGYFYPEALVGGWNTSAPNDISSQRQWVKDMKVFPGWHGKRIYQTFSDELKNNIALVRLETPVILNAGVQPLRLAPENADILGKNCTTIGWNWKAFISGGNGHAPTELIKLATLHKIPMRVVNNIQCSVNMKTHPIDEISMLCGVIENPNGAKTTLCPFEEGAALICEDDDGAGPYLAGLASLGNRDRCEENSVVYTRISHFLNFVMNT